MKRKILFILFFLLFSIFIVVTSIFVHKNISSILCNNIEIIFDSKISFVDKNYILNYLKENNFKIDSTTKISEIDFDKIEKQIKTIPYIKDVDIYNNFSGTVFFKITQRNPIARIFTAENQQFYIDDENQIIPTSPNYSALVPVVICEKINKQFFLPIDNNISDKNIINYQLTSQDFFNFLQYIDHSDLWKNQIDQIHITGKNEIELIPRIGNQIILLGTIDNFKYKLNKLNSLYQEVLLKGNWNKYQVINLKYSNQIICK